MSVVETLLGSAVMMLLTLGTMSLLLMGLKSFNRTTADLTITQDNAQGMRRVADALRSAITANITLSGKRVDFQKPALSATADPITGEKEVANPVVWDGVARGYLVDFAAGTLTDLNTGTVLVRGIRSTDPDPASSTYNQAYQPFTATMVGARRGVIINLITAEKASGQLRYQRMKTTITLRNTGS